VRIRSAQHAVEQEQDSKIACLVPGQLSDFGLQYFGLPIHVFTRPIMGSLHKFPKLRFIHGKILIRMTRQRDARLSQDVHRQQSGKRHSEAQPAGFDTCRFRCWSEDIPFYQEPSVRAENAAFYADFDPKVAEEAGHYSMPERPLLVASLVARFCGALESD
jgi:hypothetical protein